MDCRCIEIGIRCSKRYFLIHSRKPVSEAYTATYSAAIAIFFLTQIDRELYLLTYSKQQSPS